MGGSDPSERPAIVVMGVSGSGKSSVGKELARRLGIAFVDGDSLHPPANVAKMKRGEPLNDADRWPWLDRVGIALIDRARYPDGVAIACSALRRSYRDRIRERSAGGAPLFVFLDISREESRSRLSRRPGHFMPVSLVDSQFAALERPTAEEADVVRVEETGEADATVDTALAELAAHGVTPTR